jgi:hypothetical protein
MQNSDAVSNKKVRILSMSAAKNKYITVLNKILG